MGQEINDKQVGLSDELKKIKLLWVVPRSNFFSLCMRTEKHELDFSLMVKFNSFYGLLMSNL